MHAQQQETLPSLLASGRVTIAMARALRCEAAWGLHRIWFGGASVDESGRAQILR